MANGLARAYSFSFFVRPMQRLCYRSNWFQEILFRCLALFHVVHFIVSPLHSPLQLFLSPSFCSKWEDGGHKKIGKPQDHWKGRRRKRGTKCKGRKRKEKGRATNIQLDIPQDLFYLLSILFIPLYSVCFLSCRHCSFLPASRLARNLVVSTTERLHKTDIKAFSG